MAEVYVTLGEAAELEGVKYKTMAQQMKQARKISCSCRMICIFMAQEPRN